MTCSKCFRDGIWYNYSDSKYYCEYHVETGPSTVTIKRKEAEEKFQRQEAIISIFEEAEN